MAASVDASWRVAFSMSAGSRRAQRRFPGDRRGAGLRRHADRGAEPLLTWFVHKVPNVTARELESIGLSKVAASTVEKVKALDVHECLYKTLDVPGRFMRTLPFYSLLPRR